jgi:hypothetical protein
MTAQRRNNLILSIALVKTTLISGMVALCIIQIQPWQKVTGPFFATAVQHVPLLTPAIDAIAAIPWVGQPLAGGITLLCLKGADVGVLLLCALINLAEVAHMLLKLRGIEARALKGQGKGADRLTEFLELLQGVRVAAYAAELAICFAAYNIYSTGPNALIADWPDLDPSLWNFGSIFMTALNMFGFELALGTVLGLWSGMGVLTILFNQPSKADKAKD